MNALGLSFLAKESSSLQGSTGSIRPRPRIQTLSDLIFGLALSIGALTLVGQQPTSISQLGVALALYAFSFMILIRVWLIYSSITSVLPAETSFLVNLNVLLLFFVSIEPYLFNELFVPNGALYLDVSSLYGADVAAMFFILAFFAHSLVDEDKKLIPKELLGRYRFARNVNIVIALIFAVSLVPVFGSTVVAAAVSNGTTYDFTARSVLWILVLVVGWGGRFVGGRVATPSPSA